MEKIVTMHVNDLIPNNWNPNRMTDSQIEHLNRSMLKTEKLSPGGIQPIIAMKVEDNDKSVILDGEHRWRERKALYENGHPGFGDITVILIDENVLSEEEARVLTLNMNKIRGSPDPVLLAQIITDLHKTMSYDEIKEELDYDDIEVDSMKMIIDAPDFEDIRIEAEEDLISLTFQIAAEDMDFVRQTLSDVRQDTGLKSRGDALVHIFKEYNDNAEK
jgi:hypothetical protein